jgi:G3E family GTPase
LAPGEQGFRIGLQGGAQFRAERTQQAVALAAAITVVDARQVVQRQDRHHARACTIAVGDQRLQPRIEIGAIGESGHRVRRGRLAQLGDQLGLARKQLLEADHHAVHGLHQRAQFTGAR